ncbi:MAG: DUF4349 domain-containing protein [Actinomycetota bacterium]
MKSRFLKFIFPVISVFILSFLLAGCAGLSPEEMVEEAVVRESADMAFEEAPAAEPEASVEQSASEGAADYTSTPSLDRKIIKSSYLEVEIASGEFEEKLFEVSNLAERNGGFVSNSESYSDPEGRLTSGRITIRVPAEKFDSVLNQVKALGTVLSISISGQDVTEEYVDLEARLRNLRAQETVLLELMEQARTVRDSIEVQRELSTVQGEIEVLKGRLNYLDNMVSFSTIDVYFTVPPLIRETADWGFINAVRRGARGAVNVFNGLVRVLILISPVLVFIAVIIVIIWLIIRAKKRRRSDKKE